MLVEFQIISLTEMHMYCAFCMHSVFFLIFHAFYYNSFIPLATASVGFCCFFFFPFVLGKLYSLVFSFGMYLEDTICHNLGYIFFKLKTDKLMTLNVDWKNGVITNQTKFMLFFSPNIFRKKARWHWCDCLILRILSGSSFLNLQNVVE